MEYICVSLEIKRVKIFRANKYLRALLDRSFGQSVHSRTFNILIYMYIYAAVLNSLRL